MLCLSCEALEEDWADRTDTDGIHNSIGYYVTVLYRVVIP